MCFERNYRTQHLQVQMVPIPKSTVKALRGALLNAANLAGIELVMVDENEQVRSVLRLDEIEPLSQIPLSLGPFRVWSPRKGFLLRNA